VTQPARTFSIPMNHDAVTRWLMEPGRGESLEDFLRPPRWHQRAACRGVGHEAFMVAPGGIYEEHARQLCASCPVRRECLETALANVELVGFWGGTTPTERRAMRIGVA
jgi:WhiB family redox-sensing transcriptional regulator